MMMEILTILNWLRKNSNIAIKAFLLAAVGVLLSAGIILHKQNKKLSEALEIAQNNVEAYQGALNGSQQAFNVLKMDMTQLSQQNDELLHKIDSVRKENNIKAKHINTAATQTQTLVVNASKEIKGDIVEILKDTTYIDSLYYNPLTKVYYNIGKDSVNIKLDVKNTQYLYVYSKKQYKNKKNFFKRLITFDFKKKTTYQYKIVNTNELLKEDSIRVIEKI